MWTEEDDYPEYYYEDDDYKAAENLGEIRILRLLKTYHELVSQRYTEKSAFPYKNFGLNKDERQLRKHGKRYYDLLTYIANRLGDRDPAHFMTFIFEIWGNRAYYHILKRLVEDRNVPGFHFPSIYKILREKEELVRLFMAMPGYKPQQFVPLEDQQKRRKVAINNRVMRWCSAHDKTPWDYWTLPHHLHPDHMCARDFDHADTFWELDERFKEMFGVSAQGIRDGIQHYEEALEAAREKIFRRIKKIRKKGLDPEYINLITIPNENFLDEYSRKRVDYTQAALNAGVDITTDEFEQQIEERLNPIDFEHPDTVMFFSYGVGDKPRRKYDGKA